jgi:hypothetical protein
MIINSQFFITFYTGNSRLPLKTIPDNLNADQRAEYDRFIQGISTIYSSQDLSGKIPKFWTKLVEGRDALGVSRYFYIPNPDSDLEFLESKASYYFIVRDEAYLPLKIPAISGSLLGFTDNKILPNVIDLPNVVLTQSSGSYTTISLNVTNLQPYEEYLYEVKSVEANWPISVKSISGVMKPATPSGLIKAQVLFCPNSGSCDSNTLPYTLPQPCLSVQNDDVKYGILQLSIKPISYDGPEVLSDQFTVKCDQCLKQPTVSLGPVVTPLSDTNTKVVLTSSNTSEYVSYPFLITTTNLLPNETYKFNIEIVSSQWPVMFVGASSGSISANSSYSARLLLCPSTGVCRPGINGVSNYSIPSYPKFWSGDKDYDIVLKSSLSSDLCQSQIVYSDPLIITYRQPGGSTGATSGPEAVIIVDDVLESNMFE